MNDITLSTGESVTIRSHEELTERLNRPVEVAHSRSTPVGQKLNESGFDPQKKETWAIMSQLTLDEYNLLNEYKGAAIAAMVVSWPFERNGQPLPITSDDALDLPPDQFEELANLCNLAWRGEAIEPDPDPTHGGSDSTD